MTSTTFWIILGCALAIGVAALAMLGEKARRKTPLVRDQAEFQLVRGCAVADLTGIHECFSVQPVKDYHFLTINVSAEHIPATFLRLTELLSGPVFFTIEVGTHRDVEAELRKSDTEPLHKDVHYLDGLSPEDAREIFQTYSYLLTNDGMVNFGIGSHKVNDEVFVTKYKIFQIYTTEPQKYRRLLSTLGFPEEPKIRTVWENFTADCPGLCACLENPPTKVAQVLDEVKAVAPDNKQAATKASEQPSIEKYREKLIPSLPSRGSDLDGPARTVSEMIEHLKSRGLRFAERREE